MKIFLIPFAHGLGDLLRHEPLIRGIQEKHPGCEIIVFNSRQQILRHTGLMSCSIFSCRFDYIYNCNFSEMVDFEWIHEKRSQYKELFGYSDVDKATNQDAAVEYRYKTAWELGLEEVCRRRRENPKNMSQWVCEVCGIETDFKTRYRVLEDEQSYADDFLSGVSRPVVVIHTHSQGHLGRPFDQRSGFKDLSLKNWAGFIKAHPGYQFVVMGHAETDKEHLEYLRSNTDVLVSEDGFLRNNLALISRAEYFVGIDSVASHVAYALDVPSLVFYCELFRYWATPVNPSVKHIQYHKDLDTVKNITLEDMENQFERLITLNS